MATNFFIRYLSPLEIFCTMGYLLLLTDFRKNIWHSIIEFSFGVVMLNVLTFEFDKYSWSPKLPQKNSIPSKNQMRHTHRTMIAACNSFNEKVCGSYVARQSMKTNETKTRAMKREKEELIQLLKRYFCRLRLIRSSSLEFRCIYN